MLRQRIHGLENFTRIRWKSVVTQIPTNEETLDILEITARKTVHVFRVRLLFRKIMDVNWNKILSVKFACLLKKLQKANSKFSFVLRPGKRKNLEFYNVTAHFLAAILREPSRRPSWEFFWKLANRLVIEQIIITFCWHWCSTLAFQVFVCGYAIYVLSIREYLLWWELVSFKK